MRLSVDFVLPRAFDWTCTILGGETDRGRKFVVLLVNVVHGPRVQQAVGNVEDDFVEQNAAGKLNDLSRVTGNWDDWG